MRMDGLPCHYLLPTEHGPAKSRYLKTSSLRNTHVEAEFVSLNKQKGMPSIVFGLSSAKEAEQAVSFHHHR